MVKNYTKRKKRLVKRRGCEIPEQRKSRNWDRKKLDNISLVSQESSGKPIFPPYPTIPDPKNGFIVE